MNMNEMKELARLSKVIEESYGYLAGIPGLFGPDADGTLWQPMGLSGIQPFSEAALYYYQTPWFNLLQRVQGIWLWRNNGYAISGVSSLTNMVFGPGFQYLCDSEVEQAKLDNWLLRNNYAQWSREAFEKTCVMGEVFPRLYENGQTLRSVYPARVADGPEVPEDTVSTCGVVHGKDDIEDVRGYLVDREFIEKAEMQHRKLGWTEDARGISMLYAVGTALTEAAGLLFSLARTAKTLSKFAGVRYIDGDRQAAEAWKSGIKAGTQPPTQFGVGLDGYGCYNNARLDNEEYYRPGTFLDVPKAVKVDFPGQGLDGEKYVSVLRAVLRLAAARFGVPENVLSQDQDSIAAYSGQMVADGHCAKGLRAWQKRVVAWDLQLFQMAGFDSTRIKVELPEVAVSNQAEMTTTGEMLLARKLAAPSTVASMFGLNYEDEVAQMKLQGIDPKPERPVENKPSGTGDKQDEA